MSKKVSRLTKYSMIIKGDLRHKKEYLVYLRLFKCKTCINYGNTCRIVENIGERLSGGNIELYCKLFKKKDITSEM